MTRLEGLFVIGAVFCLVAMLTIGVVADFILHQPTLFPVALLCGLCGVVLVWVGLLIVIVRGS